MPAPAVAWIDGALVEAGAARIRADEAALLSGLGVFETLLLEGGYIGFLGEHLLRMETGARVLGIDWPPPWDPRRALLEMAGAAGPGPLALRVTLTAGAPGGAPSLVIGGRPPEPLPEGGVVLSVAEGGRPPGDPLSRIKSIDRAHLHLHRTRARARGAWDALLPTTEGDLAETTVANLFAVLEGELVTPDLSRGCLPGILRARVLEAWGGTAIEGRLEPADLARADEVLLTNSIGRIVPVARVSGLAAGLPGSDGRLTCEIRARIAALEERYRARSGC